ncbi:MAG: alpha-hydroxy acid oxidase [Pirellulaceae bacterium]
MDRRTFSRVCALSTAAWGSAALAVGQTSPDGSPRPKGIAAEPAAAGPTAAAGQAPATTPNPADAVEAVSVQEAVNVQEYEQRARAVLPQATFEYIRGGSADEITLRENVRALRRIQILPPLMHGVSAPDLSTRVLNQALSLPVLLAPVAAQRMYHPQGALAAARAAAALGTVYCMSSSVGHSVEEVAGASPGPKWFQLYVPKDRQVARRLVERVERAGYGAVIVTVDLGEWKDADRRNRFALPREFMLKHLRDIGFTQVTDAMSDEALMAWNAQAWDLSLSWDFFDWLRGITKLPLLIKGVLRPDDAAKAVSLGLDGIVVSNHGGRRLDGMPATIDMLPGVAAAVGQRAAVLMDSGIRRGTDVLKALALGASAVLIGRPYAWGLAAQGEAGVRHVLELLRDELTNAMIATGCAHVRAIDRSLLRWPDRAGPSTRF